MWSCSLRRRGGVATCVDRVVRMLDMCWGRHAGCGGGLDMCVGGDMLEMEIVWVCAKEMC